MRFRIANVYEASTAGVVTAGSVLMTRAFMARMRPFLERVDGRG
jgi:hypothetical protein